MSQCCGIKQYTQIEKRQEASISYNNNKNNNNNNNNGTHTFPSQCVKREMTQCCGINQYTQTERLKKIVRYNN